jgi:small subunit ribosomal protein S8
MYSDTIADMLTRIRNAGSVQHSVVSMPGSKLKVAIADALKREGYIRDYSVEEDGHRRNLRIELKYLDKEHVITGIERVSRPSLRKYTGYSDIPRILGGLGIVILSTPEGIITGQEARERKVGGEILCKVW